MDAITKEDLNRINEETFNANVQQLLDSLGYKTLDEAYKREGINKELGGKVYTSKRSKEYTLGAKDFPGLDELTAAAEEDYYSNTSLGREYVRNATLAQCHRENVSGKWKLSVAENKTRTPDEGFSDKVKLARQREIGRPGTKFTGGTLDIEANAKLRPYHLRGRASNPGLEQNFYRSDGVVFKHVNEISELIAGASYDPVMHESYDEFTIELIKSIDRDLKSIDGGFDVLLDNAATIAKHGFWTGEKVYEILEANTVIGGKSIPGYVKIVDIKHRDQSSVESWIQNKRQTKLLAAEYRNSSGRGLRSSLGADDNTFVLPNGQTPRTARLIHCALYGSGLNFEGNGPIRPNAGLIKLKKLIMKIYGVGYTKFANPKPHVKEVAAGGTVTFGNTKEPNSSTIEQVGKALDDSRAVKAGYIPIPSNVDVSYADAGTKFPNPLPMLDYIDRQISFAFSNEGAMLGHQNFGSFAMASVADDKFLRSAPVFVRAISRMFTKLLRDLVRWNHPDYESLEKQPSYNFRFPGTQNNPQWVEMMLKVLAADPSSMPKTIRQEFEKRLGLPANALESSDTSGDLQGSETENASVNTT